MTKQEEAIKLAYVAGLFDGEGSIFIGKQKTDRNKSGLLFRLHIEMCNTNELAVRRMQLYFGGSVYERYADLDTRRTLWSWQLRGQMALEFLKVISPYLRIKKPQAELAIEFQSRQRLGRYTQSHTNVLDEANQILMSQMNKGRA